ncbi:MAG: alpha-galactosidase [Ruaniaceae bacterium]|nr:alpha-galactosidase [Ruaniaceae bacterium]
MTLIEILTTGDAGRPAFHLRGANMSYVVAVTRHGHLETVHFGASLGALASVSDLDGVRTKTSAVIQGTAYTPEDPSYCLDYLPLDWSGLGKGDYRGPATEFRHTDGTFVSDFRYVGHEVIDGVVPPSGGLPGAHAGGRECATLRIDLEDLTARLQLYYTVFPETDTIVRRAVLTNMPHGGDGPGAAPIVIRSLMSQQVDIPNRGYDLVTFDGAWISEAHRHVRPVMPGTYVNQSLAGMSSNTHNPGVLLATRGAGEDHGEVFAFNLLYSGNHFTSVELNRRDLVRVRSGINPTGFEWTLAPGESFETPEATLTWSGRGFNGASAALHTFVGEHVVRGTWAHRERPVLVNNWEATYFDIDHKKVVSMARRAARLGAELFVLDDGWFGARSDDYRALGDWTVNRKKLPRGLAGLGEDVRALGLDFGLWVEPEMVNRDSDLYRAHPEWAIAVPGRTPSEGRHQLVLDLSRADVRDYLVDAIGAALDEAAVTYVKWDCNRNLSDLWSAACAPGELAHRFVLGLYEVLRRIFDPRPEILLESCASGGNRFDLGMLCFSPQIWASDCTDPVERLDIQVGLSYLYPQSTMGAHVTASPSAQTLRSTPLDTRFNVAALGLLGYELDPGRLSPAERREARAQIAFYKERRRLLQFGRMRRHENASPEHVTVSISADDTHVVGHYQLRSRGAQPPEHLPLPPLDARRRYRVTSRPQSLELARLGALVEHVLPLPVRGDGRLLWEASRWYRRPDGAESYLASGAALASLRLAPQFEGTGAHEGERMLGDYGSRLYLVEPA